MKSLGVLSKPPSRRLRGAVCRVRWWLRSRGGGGGPKRSSRSERHAPLRAVRTRENNGNQQQWYYYHDACYGSPRQQTDRRFAVMWRDRVAGSHAPPTDPHDTGWCPPSLSPCDRIGGASDFDRFDRNETRVGRYCGINDVRLIHCNDIIILLLLLSLLCVKCNICLCINFARLVN